MNKFLTQIVITHDADKIQAIKLFRSVFQGMGLKEAKDFTESVMKRDSEGRIFGNFGDTDHRYPPMVLSAAQFGRLVFLTRYSSEDWAANIGRHMFLDFVEVHQDKPQPLEFSQYL